MAQRFQQPQRRRRGNNYDEETGSRYPGFYRPESTSSDLGDTSNIDDVLTNNDQLMSSLPLSGEEINNLEQPTEGSSPSKAEQAESDAIPFRNEGGPDDESSPKGLRARVKNLSRRAKVGIGGGIITGGIGITSFFGLGSFQAIHLLQTLTPDFTPSEEASDIRMNALYRYAKSGGNFSETRLSLLGSRRFANTKAQLAEIGVEFITNDRYGITEGLRITPDKFPATKGLPPKEMPRALMAYYNKNKPLIKASDIHVEGDKVYIGGEGAKQLSISSLRALNKGSVSALEGGKLATALNIRSLNIGYLLPRLFHPFKRADAHATRQVASLDEARATQKETRKESTRDPAKAKSAYRKLQENTKGWRSTAGSALLVTYATCVARDSADEAIAFNREAVALPAALDAANAMATGAQQMAGQDFTPEQMNVFNRLMQDENGKSIWDSKALQAKINPDNPKGEEMPEEYTQAFSISGSASLLSNLGGKPIGLACSDLGQIGQAVAGLVLLALSPPSGGTSDIVYGYIRIAAGFGATVVGMNALHKLINSSIEGEAIPDNISAPLRGNLLAYGSRELANTTARMHGGVELSTDESAMLDRRAAEESNAEFQSKSFFAKVADPKESRSIAGKAIDSYGPPNEGIQNVARGFLNIGPMFANIFGGLSASAHADTTYDYGFPRYGIPQRILNNHTYDNPYENADVVAGWFKNGQHQDYIDRAKTCFNVVVSNDDGTWGVKPQEGDISPYSEEYEKGHCNDSTDPGWDRMILFVSDTLDMEAAACYLGDDDSCEIIGVDPGDIDESGGFGVRVASFNILHAPDGDVSSRLQKSVTTLMKPPDGGAPVDIAGLQEVRPEQLTMLKNGNYGQSNEPKLTGYEMFPNTIDHPEYQPNVIIWKSDKYTALSKTFVDARYFHGDEEQFPIIKFKDNASGKKFYFMDIHSPRSGNGRGENDTIRDDNARRFQEYFANLKQQEPEAAMVLVGDFNAGYQAPGPNGTLNDVEVGRRAFCILTNGIFWDAWHANKNIDDKCPRGTGVSYVDHIFVDRDTDVSKYFIARLGQSNNGSDHNTIFANIGLADKNEGSPGWSWPLKKDVNPGPCYGGSTVHAGMDMNSKTDNNVVYAMHSGKVVRQAYDDAAGNYITILADAPFKNNQVYYSYEHLKTGSVGVNVGDQVNGGQAIAVAGLTGNVHVSGSLAHLHIATATTNSLGAYGNLGTTFNPMEILSKAGPAPEGYQCYAS